VNYQVRWDSAAFRRLRSAWRRADEPQAAADAFDQIEERLTRDPHSQGESRAYGLRILIVQPLAVLFKARDDIREVLIFDAWLIRKTRP
jgi:hypothetical protein